MNLIGLTDSSRKRGRGLRWRSLQPYLVMLTVVGGISVPVAVAEPRKIENCRQFAARDYSTPLKVQTMGRRLPKAGTLPGGPSRIRIERPTDGLRVGGGRVGFVVQNTSRRKLRGLDLKFSLSLTRIGRAAKQLGRSRKSTVRIRSFGAHEQKRVSMKVGGMPAIYRLVVKAINHHIGRQVSYTEYYRVIRPRIDFELRVFPRTVTPGESVKFRLVNRGTVPVGSGRAFSVERKVGPVWMIVPSLAPPSGPQDRMVADAGMMLECERLVLPPATPPGVYRVIKSVDPVFKGSIRRQRFAAGEFSVVNSQAE